MYLRVCVYDSINDLYSSGKTIYSWNQGNSPEMSSWAIKIQTTVAEIEYKVTLYL